jgi:acetyltransferase-like isoleucine patch superfamily enzyme
VPPIRIDFGTNVKLGEWTFINSNCTIVDTCLVSIGARTMLAPNVSLYSGTHPLDPEVRDGLNGPELGKEIWIEEDCWIGGNAIILPGVRIGKGSTVGAGSVVTKDVPPYKVVAGNPARIIKDVPRHTEAERTSGAKAALERDQAAGM